MSTLPIGFRHGRLTVISDRDRSDTRRPKYQCRCDCGTVVTVQAANLPRTRSCGCLRREQLTKRSTSHGMSHSREYHIWANMLARCTHVKKSDFERYGGNGVTVCQSWIDSFDSFYADMGPRPSAKHSIDRIKNELGYSPDNCRWATAKEQRINQRRTVLYTFDGITATLKDLARHVGLPYSAVHQRVKTLHWTVSDALSKPLTR